MCNRVADAHFDFPAALFEQLAREHGGPQFGMHQTQDLEHHTVAAMEVHGQNGRAGLARDAGDGRTPGRFGDFAGAKIDMGDFSRGKDRQHPAPLHPAYCLAQRADVFPGGLLGAEGIDQQENVMHFRNAAQQVVGHHFHIGTDAPQQGRQDQAVEGAEGMIGHHDDWPGARNALEIFRPELAGNAELIQHPFHERLGIVAKAASSIQIVERIEPEKALHRRGHMRQKPLAQRIGYGRVEMEELEGIRNLSRHRRSLSIRRRPTESSGPQMNIRWLRDQ